MKVAIAQINTTAGDVVANTDKARAWIRRAREAGADIVVFPELTLVGYAPRSLLAEGDFSRRSREGLEVLADEAEGIRAVVGHVTRTPEGVGNAVSLLADGEVKVTRSKSRLTGETGWAEGRYVVPGREPVVMDEDGLSIVPLFADELQDLEDADEADVRADLAVVLDARPYFRGQTAPGEQLARVARGWKAPVVYSNLVGGNDCWVFGGGGMVLDGEGDCIERAARFQEDLVVCDASGSGAAEEAAGAGDQADEMNNLFDALRLGLSDYVSKCGFSKVVLGLSGGIDSSVVAALAASALGGENVTGVLMPGAYSSRQSTDHARAVAENLGMNYHTLSIERIRGAFRDTLDTLFMEDDLGVTDENIQARIRGMLLMALSNKFGYLPLATGNRSELAVGYCTLYGDMAGALAVIGDLSKGEVYRLARHINRNGEIIPQDVLDKPPSAELRPDQTDQDDLPPYDQLDRFLDLYLDRHEGPEEAAGEGIPRDMFYSMRRRIQRSEFKRRQAPPVLRVASRSQPEFPMASGHEPDYGVNPEESE